MNKKLHDDLPEEDQLEYEGIFKFGDEILFQFYNGNYRAGLKELTDNNIHPTELLGYIQEQLDEWELDNIDYYKGYFDTDFWIQLTQDYIQHLLEVRIVLHQIIAEHKKRNGGSSNA